MDYDGHDDKAWWENNARTHHIRILQKLGVCAEILRKVFFFFVFVFFVQSVAIEIQGNTT